MIRAQVMIMVNNELHNDELICNEDEGDEVPILNEELFEPLYNGAKVTICGAICAIMHFQSACRCSFSTIVHLLQLLHILLPGDSKLPHTLYTIRKFFKQFGSNQMRTQYCSNCHDEVNGSCTKIGCLP